MTGRVDSSGRALIPIAVSADDVGSREIMQAWIDTGFTGELVVPQSTIDRPKLEVAGTVEAVLADGGTVRLPKYDCWVDWFGESRSLKSWPTKASIPCSATGCCSAMTCGSVTLR